MILVTGGTGMLGSFIVKELQSRGQEVRVLARPGSEGIARELGAELAPGDLADHDSLRRAALGVNGIVHAACTLMQTKVDIAAMQTLLDAWEASPGAFVFISSVDVYGRPQYVPIDESHPLDENYSDYGGGKVRCESLLSGSAGAKGRSDFSILRPPHIWGPHPRCYARLVDGHLREGRPVVLPGETQAEWSQFGDAWVDTRSLAWAAAECLERPLSGAANTIEGHFIWHDVYTELIRLTGSQSRIEHKALADITEAELPNKAFYAQVWRYSGETLEKRLGFRPARGWQATLAEVVAAGA